MRTCLYGAFDCVFLSCHMCVFRVNLQSVVALMSKKLFLETSTMSEVEVIPMGFEATNT